MKCTVPPSPQPTSSKLRIVFDGIVLHPVASFPWHAQQPTSEFPFEDCEEDVDPEVSANEHEEDEDYVDHEELSDSEVSGMEWETTVTCSRVSTSVSSSLMKDLEVNSHRSVWGSMGAREPGAYFVLVFHPNFDPCHQQCEAHVIASDHALSHPISTTVQTVALLLRVMYFQVCEDPTLQSLGEFPHVLMDLVNLPSLEVLLDLYQYIMDHICHFFDPKWLMEFVHALFSSLVQCHLTQIEKVECLMDIVLILASMLPDGTFCYANQITHECAKQAHCFTAVIIHHARLGDKSQIRFSPNDPTLYHPSMEDHISCSLGANLTATESEEDDLGTQEEVEEVEADLEHDADMGIPDLEADQDPNLSPAVPEGPCKQSFK
ncbi:hypothetical protein EDC04DRAFT_2906428 [Pisolithus marmoratus]|nr:hypothetical protein EDC04DRAFT_2906428 [Pisolithus marmoratus]